MDLPPDEAVAIGKWIHKEALKLKRLGDSHGIDQLPADIYLDLLKRRFVDGKLTRADYGILDVRLTAETLTGQSNDAAELNGFGPVLGDIARQVAKHQHHVERRWSLYDPDTGQVIDGGITRRKPTTAQRRMAKILYPTCIHPGCRMPSVDCDIDHRIPWSHSRITCSCDLRPILPPPSRHPSHVWLDLPTRQQRHHPHHTPRPPIHHQRQTRQKRPQPLSHIDHRRW